MIRVAFVNHHGSVPGGGERSLEAYLRRIPSDIEPHVFLFEDGAYGEQIRELQIPVHVLSGSERLMAATRTEMRLRHAADGFVLVFRLAKLLKRLHIDAVLTSSMKAHVIGGLAARFCGIPTVVWLKDLPDGLALLLVRAISRTCAAERIGCSRAVVRRLSLAHTTALVPPIDLGLYDSLPDRRDSRMLLGVPHDKLVFSIVGRIARWKGQDRFIRAAAAVCARTDAVHFAVIGSPTFPQDHEFLPQLLRLAAELGIEDRVSFVPWIDDPRFAYVASDLVCNASAAEPFGRTSAEAAACGVPTLCFDDGGASEAVVPSVSGTVVPAGDVDAFAAAMVAYAADPPSLRRAGAAARVYVQRHDASRLAITFFDIIRRAARTTNVTIAARSAQVRDTAVPMVAVKK